MISGLSSISLLVAGILLFVFSGSIGFVSGWCARGWKHLRQGVARERWLEETRVELAKVNQLLVRKTHDLFVLQASSKSEIDELRTALKKNSRQQTDPTSNTSGSSTSKASLQDQVSDKEAAGNAQEKDIASRHKTDDQTALFSEMAANASASRQQQKQAFEQGESTEAFFNSDFGVTQSTARDPDDTESASSENTVRRQQQQLISQLMEKNRELTEKLDDSQSRQKQQQAPDDARSDTGPLASNRRHAENEDRVVELQLEKIRQLKRQLQEADKFNSDLQARTAEIPDLKAQISEFQSCLKTYAGADEKFNRLNQDFFNCEEQKVVLQSNNTQLHTQITQLKQELDSGKKAVEQQIAARRLFEQSSNDAAKALKEQLARCQALEQEISGFKSELEEKRNQIGKLNRQCTERQQFADQLDTLNLQLESDLGRHKQIILQHKEKHIELESEKGKLENESRLQKTRETVLSGELGAARAQLVQKSSALESLESKLVEHRKAQDDQRQSINRLAEKVVELEKEVQARKIFNAEREKHYAQSRYALQQQVGLSVMLSRRVDSLLPLASQAHTFKSENHQLIEKLKSADDKIILLKAEQADLQYGHEKQQQSRASGAVPEKVATIKKRRSGKGSAAKARSNAKAGNTVTKPAAKAGTAKTADNLKLIHGIGPKLEKLLYAHGITTLKQIADMDKEAVRELAEVLGVFGNRIERDKWVSSARKLVRTRQGKAA